MNKKLASSSVAFVLLLLAVIPAIASASAPPLPPEPTSLPSIPYMYNGTIYSVVSSDWITDINTVYNSKSYVSYNWTGNATEDLILFDLSYTGLNPYGQQIIEKMSEIGAPSTANFTKRSIRQRTCHHRLRISRTFRPLIPEPIQVFHGLCRKSRNL